MHSHAKHSPKPKKPSPNPTSLPREPEQSATDQMHDEGSYSGTRDYQAGVTSYLEHADVEKDARDAAPEDAAEAREMERAEQAGRRPGIKTQRPTKQK